MSFECYGITPPDHGMADGVKSPFVMLPARDGKSNNITVAARYREAL